MKLSALCKNIEATIIGNDVDVLGLQIDNREVHPGDAFFCIVGLNVDGHVFAKSAMEKGASCLFVEHKLDLDITQVIVKDNRVAMPLVSSVFYNHPSKEKKVIGVTGTNGKTTITHIVSHVLQNCAVVGTNGLELNQNKIDDSAFTTPEAFNLQKLFNDLDTKNIVMEVSAHAISQNRTLGTDFYITAFSNLTQDHLDYYKNMENYFNAKAKLFSDIYKAKRVICIDDSWGQKLYEICKNNNDEIITVGLNPKADLNPDNTKVNFPLIGKYNLQNMLIAFGICKFLNIENIEDKLETTPFVEGRMQKVIDHVFVDYAHTPDALYNAISVLREVGYEKIITVFGCGGDRDKGKRPKMGKIANDFSDYSIITNDNPRSEDPQTIVNEIIKDMKNNYEVILDRKEAIEHALTLQTENSCVLVAGKGHEKYQIIGTKKFDFDDVEVIKNAVIS